MTVSNTGTIGTGTYEQSVALNPSIFYRLSSALTNLAFEYLNGTLAPSWIQANASATSSNTPVWVRLFNIAPGVSANLYVLACKNAMMAIGGPTGEAPQLSSPYGSRDDGRAVFNQYYNFSGSSLPASIVNSGLSVTVNNGLNSTGSGYSASWTDNALIVPTAVSGPVAVEDLESVAGIAATGGVGLTNTSSSSSHTIAYGIQGQALETSNSASAYQYVTATSQSPPLSIQQNTFTFAFNYHAYYVIGATVIGTTLNATVNGTRVGYQGAHTATGEYPMLVGNGNNAGHGTAVIWFRVRDLPLTIASPTVSVLDEPTNLSASQVTATTALLSWNNPPSAILTTTVYQATFKGGCGAFSTTFNEGNITSYTVGALSAGKAYCFEVKATTTNGTSPASNVLVPVVTTPVAPAIPHSFRLVTLANFSYLSNYLYNYRIQYPTLGFSGPCSGDVIYIDNSSNLDCYNPLTGSVTKVAGPVTLMYQRTVGLQAQIDNEFQLDNPYAVALIYGNLTTLPGFLSVETVDMTNGSIHIVTTPVKMQNGVQADYVGNGTVVVFNATNIGGKATYICDVYNASCWYSGLNVGMSPNNIYWVATLHAFINVQGARMSELSLINNKSLTVTSSFLLSFPPSVTSVGAVNGLAYNSSNGLVAVMDSTNVGPYTFVLPINQTGVMTQTSAYGFPANYSLYIQRYSYSSAYIWAAQSNGLGATILVDPFANTTLAAPGVVSRQGASGANGNFELTNPTTTSVYLSLNGSLIGRTSLAPNQFVYVCNGCGTPPSAPTGVTVNLATATSLNILWANPPGGGLLNDTVYYSVGPSCGGATKKLSTNGVATSETITGLPSASQVCVQVTAWNLTGESPKSSSIIANTLFPQVSISPASGTVGSSFQITGAALTARTAIQVSFATSILTPSTCSDGSYSGTTVTADITGAFACTFLVPSLPLGQYNVVAVDINTSATSRVVFNVTQSSPGQGSSISLPGLLGLPLFDAGLALLVVGLFVIVLGRGLWPIGALVGAIGVSMMLAAYFGA